ncbi:hypothetical protein AG1IA_06078 [Rhizoctonia solani AG-1 IA]|uniref:Uncharacterized protein n=1 Tax=Thanatephorus cucumeris (strain AG1-IA) TaxID=983506 RepID=L8WPI4_THACA|nr:hypothetical protein AG1IA_06078 [Rhizoctonia solani AG-1 IA]
MKCPMESLYKEIIQCENHRYARVSFQSRKFSISQRQMARACPSHPLSRFRKQVSCRPSADQLCTCRRNVRRDSHIP